MGGQSYKCPICPKWFFEKGALKDHARDKHGFVRPSISGAGDQTIIKDIADPAALKQRGET